MRSNGISIMESAGARSAPHRRMARFLAAALAGFVVVAPAASYADSGLSSEEKAAAVESAWPGLVTDVFDDRPMVADTDAVTLDAPARATDPALVPVKITLDPERDIRKVTLVIDENPSPVAATFTIGKDSGLTELSTRVRVNSYTDVHVVAEAADGTLYVTKRFVKAAGGCAAPASKDPEVAAREMGQMKFRRFGAEKGSDGTREEAQLLIRHPNNSGLQKDQVTLLYIPAHFITNLEVTRGDEPVFSMEGGISISEDPSFRFDYGADGPQVFTAKATDTEGNVWEKSFAPGNS